MYWEVCNAARFIEEWTSVSNYVPQIYTVIGAQLPSIIIDF